MPTPKLPIYTHEIVTSDTALKSAGGHRVMAVQLMAAAGAAVTLELNDSDDNSGTDRLKFEAEAGTTVFVDYTNVGGVIFSAGIYADLTGASSWAAVWVD